MRFGLIVLVVLLAEAAAAQTPQPETNLMTPSYAVPGGLLALEDVQKLPPDGALAVVVDNVGRSMKVADILKLLQEGKLVRSLRTVPTQPPSCTVDYAEITAEKKASDDRLRQMQRRGDIIPVLHQYEQEMYYEDRRNRLYVKTCGKPRGEEYRSLQTGMNQRACAALGVVCKPRKHW